MYSDNETVDVASSDETEDSDNDKEDNINDVNNDKNQQQQPTSSRPSEVKSPSLSDILSMGHNNLDFLSEIYNTAFSKVPKVIIFTSWINTKISLSRCMPVTALTVSILTTPEPGTTAVWMPALSTKISTEIQDSVETCHG